MRRVLVWLAGMLTLIICLVLALGYVLGAAVTQSASSNYGGGY